MVLDGKRRDYITIQVATKTTDNQGGYTTAWADTYYEWASSVPLSQSRVLDQGGVKYRLAVEFKIRARTDYTLSSAHRIKWGTDYYTIHSVVPSPKRDDLTVIAYV